MNPTPAIRAAHAATGLPVPPQWGGYWNWVAATIILAFMLYTAQKGTLGTWLGFFAWTAPGPVGSASTPSNDQSGVGQILNGPAANSTIPATTPGQANAIPFGQVGSAISKAWNGLINPSFLGGGQ